MSDRIVAMQPEHLAEVVDIHLRAFPSFFLSCMGRRFLRHVYRFILDDPTAFGLVALDERTGQVTGHISGTLEPAGYYRRMIRRRFWGFFAASIPVVLRRPAVLPKLIRRLRFRGAVTDDRQRALLMSICVDPAIQGRGLGKLLISRWSQEAFRRGADGLYLATDAVGNDSVNAFYARCGWTLHSTYGTQEGRQMNRYVLDEPPSDPLRSGQ